MISKNGLSRLQVPLGIEPMEAKLVDELPAEQGWQFEPKWDGFRCLAFRSGSEVALHAKSGKPLGRYFPDVVALLQSLPEKRFVLDGELLIQENRTFSFDALQMRLHPAESRVRKLSEAMPATYVLFDMLLSPEAESLLQKPFTLRLAALGHFFANAGAHERLQLSPYTCDRREAVKWLEQAGHVLDGVMAKQLDATYQPGVRAMLKVKLQRTADCIVGGFRYGTGSKKVGSLLLGLYDAESKLDHVGFTSTIPPAERPALTKKLETLRAPPGFTGRAPGGPSRWSTARSAAWVPVRPKLVVEVRYDRLPAAVFATAQGYCDSGRIRRPGNAHSSSSSLLPDCRKSWRNCSALNPIGVAPRSTRYRSGVDLGFMDRRAAAVSDWKLPRILVGCRVPLVRMSGISRTFVLVVQ